MQWADLVQVAPRYSRSVNLERDLLSASALEGYVITSTAYSVLGRLLSCFEGAQAQRAWTLTGPYGSGKSAFALFFANLMCHQHRTTSIARHLLKEQRPDLHREFFEGSRAKRKQAVGYTPILVTGSQEPLLDVLLDACMRDLLVHFQGNRFGANYGELCRLRDDRLNGKEVSPTTTVSLLARISRHLKESGRSLGIVILIDELGKFLEYASANPERSDVYVLQQLAEATARSAGNHLCVITILHQGFERYAASLRPTVRDEWAKIQGRFEDVAFQEPPDQVLALLATAIQQKENPLVKRLRAAARERGERAFELGLAPRGASQTEFIRNVERCAPLHPLTVLVLARLCRKFGQNQRSLFSFLVSGEPHGFADFLSRQVEEASLPVYGLPELFDYVQESLGPALSAGEGGIRWVEAQSALDRASDCSLDEVRLLKSVGILSATGAYGNLKPSLEVLKAAMDQKKESAFPAYKSLLKRSLLIERKYNGTVGLWEGSDIDLDERLREAGRALPESPGLATKLNSLWAPRPVVAKRHSYITGTLRYFAVRFADVTNFSKNLSVPADADGLLVYAMPGNTEDSENLTKLSAAYSSEHPDTVIALPREIDALREAVRQLELLHWAGANTPELQSDAVARRELRTRIASTEFQVAQQIQTLFQPSDLNAKRTIWFYRGHGRQLSSSRSLANLLSDVCYEVYRSAPVLKNELINRRYLSSSAAAARRNLIEAMLQKGNQYRCGFEGHPPEVSIYWSILEGSGIHREAGGSFSFVAPYETHSLSATWKAIEGYLAGCELERKPVAELFDLLQGPPFGIKMGVIPILFATVALAYDAELALYEDGIFLAEVGIDAFERLVKSPEKFEIRRYRVEGVRREVFDQMANVLGTPAAGRDVNLVELMRPLYRFFNRLPAYTRQTKRLSATAVAVRGALFDAREPDTLLFSDLPIACGLQPFSPAETDPATVSSFFKRWRAALIELQKAHGDLLADLKDLLFKAFGLEGPKGREVLQLRARDIVDHCVEARLRTFALHLSDDSLEEAQWIEATATMISGKVPRSWTDNDRAQFEISVGELVRSFRHIWLLVSERTKRLHKGGAPTEVMRIGVTDLYAGSSEQIISVGPPDQAKVAELVSRVEQVLDGSQPSTDYRIELAALAMVVRKYLKGARESVARDESAVTPETSRA